MTELQRRWQGDVLVVTQNIDDLHERAGTTGFLHMHGELLCAHCARRLRRAKWTDDLTTETECPNCARAGQMRPDVVWFGEMPMHMDTIEKTVERASLFLSIGTSGTVYPAAGLVQIARAAGAHTVELNLEQSIGASSFHETTYGLATHVVPNYIRMLLDRTFPPKSTG